jgi:hypothetical protein
MLICVCCAGKMTAGSPRNPNMCISCEQLVDDDCMQDELLASVPKPEPASRPTEQQEVPARELHEIFSI